jgi:hypothetical protein
MAAGIGYAIGWTIGIALVAMLLAVVLALIWGFPMVLLFRRARSRGLSNAWLWWGLLSYVGLLLGALLMPGAGGTASRQGFPQTFAPIPPQSQIPAGWYHANGDPVGTVRYWNGVRWVGDSRPLGSGS